MSLDFAFTIMFPFCTPTLESCFKCQKFILGTCHILTRLQASTHSACRIPQDALNLNILWFFYRRLAMASPLDTDIVVLLLFSGATCKYIKQNSAFLDTLRGHHVELRACLHGVWDPGLVGLVSFVFTLCGTQNKRNLPH